MRKHTLDNKKVLCKNVPYVSYYKGPYCKRGDVFIYEVDYEDGGRRYLARSLGRIATVEYQEHGDCRGYISALVISEDHQSAYTRWINPLDVRAIFDAPTKMARWFFAPTLPPVAEILGHYERGSLCESFLPD